MVQKRKNNKKWLWWGCGAVVVLIIVAVIVEVVVAQNNTGESDNETTAEQVDATESGRTEDADLVNAQAEKQKVVQYEGDDPNELDELTGVVTYAGVNDGSLMIRVSIDQYVTDGTCALTLERGGATIYNSIANIMGDVATATCEGFDVPVAELGGGNLQIVIKLSADEREGEIRGEANI